MKVEIEEVSPTRRKIAVEVPAERVATEFERAFRSVSQRARIKGFRPGRIPRPVLERFFGEEVRNQVATLLVREGVGGAIEQSNLQVVSQPELDIGTLSESEALRFSATVDVRPELGAIDLEGLAAERPVVPIGDAEVDKVVEQLRQRFAELVPVEGRAEVARGDFAKIDVAVACEGRTVEGMGAQGATVEVGAGALPSTVDERLAIARVGETFAADAPAPEGAPEDIAGKNLSWQVTVQSISERRLPEVDDEFAKDHGDCETLGELREKIRVQLEQDTARRADSSVREQVVEQLLSRTSIDVPASLVERRTEELLSEFKMELMGRGLQLASTDHETEAKEKLLPRAERDVRIGLLLDALARQLEVEVSDEDLAERIGRILASAGRHRDQLREHYQHEHARDAVRSEMRRATALERIVERAAVREGAAAPG
jgi:trigger factor